MHVCRLHENGVEEKVSLSIETTFTGLGGVGPDLGLKMRNFLHTITYMYLFNSSSREASSVLFD